MNPKEIFPELTANRTELKGVFLVLPRGKFQIEEITKLELCEHLLMNQMLDTLLFLPYISEYSYIFPKSKLAMHWKLYKENLKRDLPDDIPFYKVDVPQKYDLDVFNKIHEFVEVKR